jgi:hypothetical protein
LLVNKTLFYNIFSKEIVFLDGQLEGIKGKALRETHIVALQEAFHHGRKETAEEVKAFGGGYSSRRGVFADAYKYAVFIPFDENALSIRQAMVS